MLVVPKGTVLNLYFRKDRPDRASFGYHGHKLNLLVVNLHSTVKPLTGKPFTKMPGLTALERMSDNGIATTVTGHRVEPDGYGPDDSPSWMLVAGVI